MKVALLATTDTVNGIPSAATHGVKLRMPKVLPENDAGDQNECVVAVTSTAGSGVMTCKVALWGYHVDLGKWVRWKFLNGGSDIAETSTDSIKYAEVVTGLRHFDRVYAELNAIAGTATSVAVDLFLRQARPGAP